MVIVTKTVIHFENGTKMTDNVPFYLMDLSGLEKRRIQDKARYGAERVIYHYYEK